MGFDIRLDHVDGTSDWDYNSCVDDQDDDAGNYYRDFVSRYLHSTR